MNFPTAGLLGRDVAAPRWLPVWRVLLMLQAALALIVIWMLPHGFPWSHPRFVANVVLPLLLAMISFIGLWAAWKRTYRLLALVVASVLFLWVTCLIAGLVVFPMSAARFQPMGLIGALLFGIAYRASFGHVFLPIRAAIPVLVAAIGMGAMLPLLQRGPEPTTRPLDIAIPTMEEKSPPAGPTLLTLDEQTSVNAAVHEVNFHPGLRVQIQPLLHFESCSPDRCWTVLASNEQRNGPRRRLVAMDPVDGGFELRYGGDALSLLRVSRTGDGAVAIEGFTQVPQPVYSHLNSYTEILISGHQRLEFGFSPCPETRIEVFPADYPVGRPMRLAYVDADRRFRIVESSSGEKGPFQELARGELLATQPLTITCYDSGKPRCQIELADWSAQLSTDLSPTAGWGVTQNAIEFSLLGNQPSSTAAVWLTLAATSVGRGWDSVGHAAGVYQNRMRIEAISSEGQSDRSD